MGPSTTTRRPSVGLERRGADLDALHEATTGASQRALPDAGRISLVEIDETSCGCYAALPRTSSSPTVQVVTDRRSSAPCTPEPLRPRRDQFGIDRPRPTVLFPHRPALSIRPPTDTSSRGHFGRLRSAPPPPARAASDDHHDRADEAAPPTRHHDDQTAAAPAPTPRRGPLNEL